MELRRPLWAHQREALAKMEGREEAFALLMAMRLGKTATTIVDYARLEEAGEVDNLLVVAPGGVYRTWSRAIQDDMPEALLDRSTIHVWRSGDGAGLERERRAFMAATGPRTLIMNVEALSSVKKARGLATAFLEAGRAMAVVDESTTIKSHRAERTKFLVQSIGSRARFRRILSGLPAPQSPLDLFSQFEFLDWRILGQRSFYSFRSRYATTRRVHLAGRSFDQVTGFQNVDELQGLIAPYSYRKTLEDVYDLPPKMYSRREVALTERQRRVYEELRQFATAQLASEEHVSATMVITQMLRLHQVLCGFAVDEVGNLHQLPEKRTEALLELLGEYDGKAIIWASYDHSVRSLRDALGREFGPESVAAFWGGNAATREEDEARFLGDPSCRFMVATPAAGGRGRTWTVADLVVYFSNGYDLEHRSQSEERAQGVGKTKSVAYVDLVTPGTVDEKILEALRRKINLAATITGDDWRNWLA